MGKWIKITGPVAGRKVGDVEFVGDNEANAWIEQEHAEPVEVVDDAVVTVEHKAAPRKRPVKGHAMGTGNAP